MGAWKSELVENGARAKLLLPVY